MWSTIMIIAGIILSLATVCLTLFLTHKKDKQEQITLWLKSISIIATCLALCAAGAVINVLSVRVDIQGDNNSVSLQFAEGNIENAPGSALIEDVPSPDYDTVDEFIIGWADSNGGREAYTLDQVNSGKLDSSIVFNSISDGSFGHEFNFVGARENNGETIDYWNANEIEAEEGKTYTVRLFCHNNSRIASNVAENVQVSFSLSDTKYVANDDQYEAAVHGYIRSSNSNPEWVSDGVKFTSDRPFHLVYIIGTAMFENNAIGSMENGGFRMDDTVVGDWVTIGYDKMDGRIPGCYQYSSISTIKVMPVFED